jgi:hypothetical protein
MNERTRYFALACLLLVSSLASAQSDSNFAVEGHAFDRRTLQPLRNVQVQLRVHQTDSITTSLQTVTDHNGFYSLEQAVYTNPESVDVRAGCKTRGVTVLTLEPLFTVVQPKAVYRRDFYLSLPAGTFSCQGGLIGLPP